MRPLPPRRSSNAGLRGLPRAVVSGLLAAALVFFAALGGTAYFFCAPMERSQLSCCCPRGASHEVSSAPSDGQVAVVASSCCEGRRVSSLPPTTGALHADVRVPPPMLVAMVPLLLWLGESVELDRGVSVPPGNLPRAGPEPPVYARCCAYLI